MTEISQTYAVGLPVVISVHVDGDVSAEVDMNEAGAAIRQYEWAPSDDIDSVEFERHLVEHGDLVDRWHDMHREGTFKVVVEPPEDEDEYVGELAQFTRLIDASACPEIDDVGTWEMGRLLLLQLRDDNLTLGVSDYTEEYWEVVLYVNHSTNDEAWFPVTDRIGRVHTDSPAGQLELGQRISYYLSSPAFEEDRKTMTTLHMVSENDELYTLCGSPNPNSLTVADRASVNCKSCKYALSQEEEGDEPPTYHGIMKAHCHSCGFDYTSRRDLEILNDLGSGCHRCKDQHAVITWTTLQVSTTWVDEDQRLHTYRGPEKNDEMEDK